MTAEAVTLQTDRLTLRMLCEADLDDVPQSAKSKVQFHFVRKMSEVLDIALGIKV